MKVMKIKFLRDITISTYLRHTWESWGSLANISNVKFICKEGEELDTFFLIKNIDEPVSYFWKEEYILIIPNDSFEIIKELSLEEYENYLKEIAESSEGSKQ